MKNPQSLEKKVLHCPELCSQKEKQQAGETSLEVGKVGLPTDPDLRCKTVKSFFLDLEAKEGIFLFKIKFHSKFTNGISF